MSGFGLGGSGNDAPNDLPEYRELRRPKMNCPQNNIVGSGDGYFMQNPQAWNQVWSGEGGGPGGDSCAQAMAAMSLQGGVADPAFAQPTYLGAPVTPVRPVVVPKSVLSPDAPVFVPRSLQQAEPTVVASTEDEDPELEAYVMHQLDMTLHQVTVNPGKFDTVVPSMVKELHAHIKESPFIAKCIADILFEQSVVERNFRYNGARICSLFCNKPDEKNTFRQVLLQRCQQEHSLRNQMLEDPTLQERLRGFTHVIGELFVNIEINVNNVGQKIDQLGSALLELFDTLLQKPDPDNLKCVAQLMKFSGAGLEDFATRSGQLPRMNKLFEKIHDFTTNSTVSKLMQEMFKNVEALRACNWGRQVQSTSTTANEPSYDNYPVDQPVLYGPDGVPMSLEEAQFLESNDGAVDFEEEDYEFHQPGVTWSTNETATEEDFDNEIAAAYEDYLRELSKDNNMHK